MKKNAMVGFFRRAKSEFLLIATAALLSFVASFSLLDKFDFKLYDMTLSLKKEARQSEKILFVEIDDSSLDAIGQWQWTRNIVADSLLRMKELGARTAVLDLDYTRKSSGEELSDVYFSKALGFFKDAWVPASNFQKFVSSSKGSGFSDGFVDSDGSQRRTKLFIKYDEPSVAQLGFSPLLEEFSPNEILRTRSSLVLKGACDIEKNGDGKKAYLDEDNIRRKDIVIPLDRQGRMLVNWSHGDFSESFRHESFLRLYELDRSEKKIVNMLSELLKLEVPVLIPQSFSYFEELSELLSEYDDMLRMKNALLEYPKIGDEDFERYFSVRKSFFENVKNFCSGKSLAEISAYLEQLKKKGALSENLYENYVNSFTRCYDKINSENESYRSKFSEMEKSYSQSICFLGDASRSSSTLYKSPFSRSSPRIAFHANVYNTILKEDFIRPLSFVWGVLIALVLGFVYLRVVRGKNVLVRAVLGFAMILVVAVLPFVLMRFFALYFPSAAAVLILAIFFILDSILRSFSGVQDKKAFRRAFSSYVSPSVLSQVLDEPEQLKLSGEERHMTALFTGLKSFSSFEELVTPKNLVSTLNEYFTAMGEEVFKAGGTFDKCSGDSVASFFGAPLSSDDHAWNACVAAINMKKIEAKFNEMHLKKGSLPRALHTRIGINTGDMILGDIGTNFKMNYSVMGGEVNFASRIERMNKIYRSWILCSEATWKEADKGERKGLLLARRLDKVRFSENKKPVQLYNILGFKSELPKAVVEGVDIFNMALDLYLKKDFNKAGKYFIAANKKNPKDETSLIFASRCKDYIKNGIPENWDGVLNMISK